MTTNKRQMEEVYSRLRRLLPGSRDSTLVVLKAHLLAEEQLDCVLETMSRSPEALRDARLSFHQKLRVCNALLGDAREWRFLSALNALRNLLSHNAEVPDVDARIDKMISDLDGSPAQFSGRAQRLTVLKNATIITCGVIRGRADEFVMRHAAQQQHAAAAASRRC